MQLDQDVIKEILERFQKGLTFPTFFGALDESEHFEELKDLVAFSFLNKPNLVFDLLSEGISELLEKTTLSLEAVSKMQEAFQDLLWNPKTEIPQISELKTALSNAIDYQNRSSITFLKRSLDQFLEKTKPAVSKNGVLHYSRFESVGIGIENGKTVFDFLTELADRVPALISAVQNLKDLSIGQKTQKNVLQQFEKELEQIEQNLDQKIQKLEDFLTAFCFQDFLEELDTDFDLEKPKLENAQGKPTGNGEPAFLENSISAPFNFDSTNNTFLINADGTDQTFILPLAKQAEISCTNSEPYIFPVPSKAKATATNAGPYTTPVRHSGSDLELTNGSRVAVSASGGFNSNVQKNDLIKTAVFAAHVSQVIDDQTLLLDRPSTVTQSGTSFEIFRDNRFKIVLHGTKKTVELTAQGGAIPYSVWENELNSNLPPEATVSSSGGLITVEDNGSPSFLSLENTEPVSLMGMPYGYITGAPENTLSVKTDQGTETIQIDGGVYTAAQLASHINSKITGNWYAAAVSGKVVLRSNTRGQTSFIEILQTNTVLGVFEKTQAKGQPVFLDEILTAIDAQKTVPFTVEEKRSQVYSATALTITAGSNTVTDLTADFSNVEDGDAVFIESGFDNGWYKIVSHTNTTLTLDSFSPTQNQAGVPYRILRNRFVLRSQTVTPDTKIEIRNGTANPVLGFSNGQKSTGDFLQLEIFQNSSPIDLDLLKIEPGDLIFNGTSYFEIEKEISDSVVQTKESYPGDAVYSVTVFSKGQVQFERLKTELSNWITSSYPRDLNSWEMKIAQGVAAKNSFAVSEARKTLQKIEALFNDLKTILSKFDPDHYEELENLRDLILEEEASLFWDYLTEGRFQEAFAIKNAKLEKEIISHLGEITEKEISPDETIVEMGDDEWDRL